MQRDAEIGLDIGVDRVKRQRPAVSYHRLFAAAEY